MDPTTTLVIVGLIGGFAAFLLWLFTYHGPWMVGQIKKWLLHDRPPEDRPDVHRRRDPFLLHRRDLRDA